MPLFPKRPANYPLNAAPDQSLATIEAQLGQTDRVPTPFGGRGGVIRGWVRGRQVFIERCYEIAFNHFKPIFRGQVTTDSDGRYVLQGAYRQSLWSVAFTGGATAFVLALLCLVSATVIAGEVLVSGSLAFFLIIDLSLLVGLTSLVQLGWRISASDIDQIDDFLVTALTAATDDDTD